MIRSMYACKHGVGLTTTTLMAALGGARRQHQVTVVTILDEHERAWDASIIAGRSDIGLAASIEWFTPINVSPFLDLVALPDGITEVELNAWATDLEKRGATIFIDWGVRTPLIGVTALVTDNSYLALSRSARTSLPETVIVIEHTDFALTADDCFTVIGHDQSNDQTFRRQVVRWDLGIQRVVDAGLLLTRQSMKPVSL